MVRALPRLPGTIDSSNTGQTATRQHRPDVDNRSLESMNRLLHWFGTLVVVVILGFVAAVVLAPRIYLVQSYGSGPLVATPAVPRSTRRFEFASISSAPVFSPQQEHGDKRQLSFLD